jgi:hypothetical protein
VTRARPRARIRSADAVLVRSRVEAAAAALGLRCGLLTVLTAVLALTVGYKKLRDDPAIRHVAAKFPAGTRILSATTIGRLLRQLDAAELIVYRPARGRGRTAQLAVHPRFCDGVSELARDRQGRVITSPDPRPGRESDPEHGLDRDAKPAKSAAGDTGNVEFSAPPFLIEEFPRKDYPLPPVPDGTADDSRQTPPAEVDVERGAVGRVLTAIPQCYRSAPAPVRWCIGAAIKGQLARGWREDQIVATLAAPLPGEVRKPLVLARYRFAKNMPGAGPRLRPLQRAWDRAHAALERASHANQQASDYTVVIAEVGPAVARRMAACAQQRAAAVLGVWAQPRTPIEQRAAEESAVVSAARMARRDHPGQSLRDAVTAWLSAHQPPPAPATADAVTARSLTVADLIAATPAGRCVKCRSVGAITRGDLPMPVPVCEDCWQDAVCEHAWQQESEPTQATAAGVEACGRREAC